MKKIFSTSYSDTAIDSALLFLRITISIFMIHHGYQKASHFAEMQEKFISFLGFSGSISLCLALFAEIGCSILIILGLMTRLAAIPLIITMSVAIIVAHDSDILGKGEPATVFLIIYLFLLIVGPGRYSADETITHVTQK